MNRDATTTADAEVGTQPETPEPPTERPTERPSTADIAAAGAAAPPKPGDGIVETQSPATGTEAALFDETAAHDYRERWLNIQTEFVDEPRAAVEKADALVAEVMTQLADTFARERKDMEHRLSGGQDTSTEDLRQAIRRYRSFFTRLLAV
jgi:hypothetical protein